MSGAGFSGIARWLPASLTTDPDEHPESRVRRSTRDWIVDACCFLLAGGWGVYSATIVPDRASVAEPLLVADQLVGAAACIALWWRRRWPVGLAVALLPISLASYVASGAIAVALFTVAVHRRWPVVLVVGGLHVLAVLPYTAIRTDPGLSYWQSATLSALLCVAVIAWGMFVRARRQLVISLRERARRAEIEVRLRDERARHLERERIAREMHDVLAHRISMLSMHAGALEFRPDAPAGEIASAAATIRESARAALRDLREVLGVLRGGAPDDDAERPQPTLSEVSALVAESRLAGMRVTVHEDVTAPEAVPATVGRTAYRIVQEGLTNARKHAPDARVWLSVTGAAGSGVTVELRNPLAGSGSGLPGPESPGSGSPGSGSPGSGAPESGSPESGLPGPELPGSGAGLVGLAERVSLAGGRFQHDVTSDEFRVHAWLPWPA